MSSLFVHSAGWTFVHFLWQGVAIGALYGIFLGAFRARPQVRYMGGCFALLLMVGVTAKTYQSQLNSLAEESQVTVEPAEVIYKHAAITFATCHSCHVLVDGLPEDAATPEIVAIDQSETNVSEREIPRLLAWGIGIWLAGVAFLSLRLAICQVMVQRLRKNHLGAPKLSVVSALEKIRKKLGVTTSVQIYRSNAVTIPIVTGWLRPVILLPEASVARLSDIQLDAIIAHEVGHIRRRDYLVNFLQHLIEIVLFFHPVVWLISSSIRHEREFCCDEIAANSSRSAVDYARALATLEKLRSDQPILGLAANGGTLLARIKCLGGHDRPRSGSLLLSSLLGLVAAISIPFTILPMQAGTVKQTREVPRVEILPLPSSEAERGFRHLLAKTSEANLAYGDFTELTRSLDDSTLQSMIREIGGQTEAGYSSWARKALRAEREYRQANGPRASQEMRPVLIGSCMMIQLSTEDQRLFEKE